MIDTSVATIPDKDTLIHAVEEKHRAVINIIDTVLSIGDFQKQIDHPIEPDDFIRLTNERIHDIIAFDTCAIFFVDQLTSNIGLSCCSPATQQQEAETQFEYLVQQGHVAWALREQRGIMVYSKDRRYRIVLHSMTTYSRIRGLFIGWFPIQEKRWPQASHQAISLILRNAANTLESLEYIELFKRQNAELHAKVDEKVGELRRRDRQLENARKMDAIATLAGGVAHQYNNALLVLFGNLDLIKLGLTNPQGIEVCLERMETTARKMQDLTAKLLAYARGGKYMPQIVTVEELMQEVLSGLKTSYGEEIGLDVRLPANDCFVYVDVMQMQLALSAVITNAAEAVEKGGRIGISCEKVTKDASSKESWVGMMSGEYVALHISDNGQGMNESTLHRMFEPFFTTKFEGRGLSMAAVYGIIQNHQGSIAVESQIGLGTIVHIHLPLTHSGAPSSETITRIGDFKKNQKERQSND